MAYKYQNLIEAIHRNPELTKAEIAEIMNMTRSNVGVTLHKIGTSFPLVRREAVIALIRKVEALEKEISTLKKQSSNCQTEIVLFSNV